MMEIGHFCFERLVNISYHNKVHEVLAEKFNVTGLKNESQYEAMMSILDGRSDVTLNTVGSGKSLCYLVPAMIRAPKVTLVFCPSVRRIEGRVKRLVELNIPNLMIHSEMPVKDQIKAVEEYLSDNKKIVLIYMTPDLVFCEHFKKLTDFLKSSNSLAYLVLDESYNEHKWQSGEKKEYQELSKLRSPDLNWVILTATDRYGVLNRIKKILSFRTFDIDYDPSTDLCRRNTFYDVITYNDPEITNEDLKQFIVETLGDDNTNFPSNKPRGLIFCRTGRMADQIAKALKSLGLSIDSYHPGKKRNKLELALKKYFLGDLQLLAITSSVGKKMKNSRLRLIIHWGLPPSIKTYYSESGLARGYNGTLAKCRIYVTNEALSYYNEERESDLRSCVNNGADKTSNVNAKKRLNLYLQTSNMKDYCMYTKCRHEFLIRHFDRKMLCCEYRCDYCKKNEKDNEFTRLMIRSAIENEGIPNFIDKFGDEVKYQITSSSDPEGALDGMRTIDELFKMTTAMGYNGRDDRSKIRNRKLVQKFFEDICPQDARKLYEYDDKIYTFK